MTLIRGLSVGAFAIAEDPLHAAERFWKAAETAIKEKYKTRDPNIAHEYEIDQYANMLAACDEHDEAPHGSDPRIMKICSQPNALQDELPANEQTEIRQKTKRLELSPDP